MHMFLWIGYIGFGMINFVLDIVKVIILNSQSLAFRDKKLH